MIKYTRGDLVEAIKSGEVEAIAHSCNCFNTMGSGVAKAIRETFPEAYDADCKTIKGDKTKLGTFSYTWTSAPLYSGLVYNLYGQFDYGRDPCKVYTNLDALGDSLRLMAIHLKDRMVQGIGIPKLGCGLGGAKWEDVVQMVESHLRDFNVTVYTLE